MSLNLKVGIVGLGAIGLEIAKKIDAKKLPNMRLVAVSSRDLTKAKNKLKNFDYEDILDEQYFDIGYLKAIVNSYLAGEETHGQERSDLMAISTLSLIGWY